MNPASSPPRGNAGEGLSHPQDLVQTPPFSQHPAPGLLHRPQPGGTQLRGGTRAALWATDRPRRMSQNYLKAWHLVWLIVGGASLYRVPFSTLLPKRHWDASAPHGVKLMGRHIPQSAKQPGRAGSARESHPLALSTAYRAGWLWTQPHPPAPRYTSSQERARGTSQVSGTHTKGAPRAAFGNNFTQGRRHPLHTHSIRDWSWLPMSCTQGSVVSSGEGSQPALNLEHLGATYSIRDQLCSLKPP